MDKEIKKELTEIIHEEIAVLVRATNAGFESVDKRFESVDKRFESVDKRFESVEKSLNHIEHDLKTFKRETNENFKEVHLEIAQLKENLIPFGQPNEVVDLYGRVEYIEKYLNITSGK